MDSYNQTSTIVLSNDENIEEVVMEDDSSIQTNNHLSNTSNVDEQYEINYWKQTRDVDYRVELMASTLPMKHLSRKKLNKLKRQTTIYGSSGKNVDFVHYNIDSKNYHLELEESKLQDDSTIVAENVDEIEKTQEDIRLEELLNMDDIDQLPVSRLESYYTKLKEELKQLGSYPETEVEEIKSSKTDPFATDIQNDFPVTLSDDDMSISETSGEDYDVIDSVNNSSGSPVCAINVNENSNNVENVDPLSQNNDIEFQLKKMRELVSTSPPSALGSIEKNVDSHPKEDVQSSVVSEIQTDMEASIEKENILRERLIKSLLAKRIQQESEELKKRNTQQNDSVALAAASKINTSNSSTRPDSCQTGTQFKSKSCQPLLPSRSVRQVTNITKNVPNVKGSNVSQLERFKNLKASQHASNIRSIKFGNKRVGTNKRNVPSSRPSMKMPVIDYSKYRLVINFSDSDESEGNEEEVEKVNQITEEPSLSDLKQAESNFSEKMAHIKEMNNKYVSLSLKKNATLKKVTKSKSRLEKCKRLLENATKSFKIHMDQLKKLNENLKTVKESLDTGNSEIVKHRQECTTIGSMLYGSNYKAPSGYSKNLATNSINTASLLAKNEQKKDVGSSKIQSLMKSKSVLKNTSSDSFSNSNREPVIPLSLFLNLHSDLFKSSLLYQTGKSSIAFYDVHFHSPTNVMSTEIECLPDEPMDIEHAKADCSSVLEHFNSYRFSSQNQQEILSENWSNGLDPNQYICIFDLVGVCNDSNCAFQHQKNYIYSEKEKFMDLLTYLPQIAEILNLEEDKKDYKEMKDALIAYVQKQFESQKSAELVCQEIISQIKSQSKTSISSFFLRTLPKEVVTFTNGSSAINLNQVPFDDYTYSFDFKDEQFKMKLFHVFNSNSVAHPDICMKNRFFAPEGVTPLNAKLEKALSEDPHNIQKWLLLAHCYFNEVKNGDQDLNYCIDMALSVLSRALENNRDSAELYEQYLYYYSNKCDLYESLQDEPSNAQPIPHSVHLICRQILKHCNSYKLWFCYLNMSYKLEDKLKIIEEIFTNIVEQKIKFDNDEQKSFHIVEMIFHKINLFINWNKREELVQFFYEIFHVETRTKLGLDVVHCRLHEFITDQHLAFCWLCYIHFFYYRSLPYEYFRVQEKRSFLKLRRIESFLFDWSEADSTNLQLLKKILRRAIKNCCPDNTEFVDDVSEMASNFIALNCHRHCYALKINLNRLNHLISTCSSEDDSLDVKSLKTRLCLMFSNDSSALTDLANFELNDNLEVSSGEASKLGKNAFIDDSKPLDTDFSELVAQMNIQLKFNYWLSFYCFKIGNIVQSKKILKTSLHHFYVFCDENETSSSDLLLEDDTILRLYENVLLHDLHFDIEHCHSLEFSDRFKLKPYISKFKSSFKMAYFYLSYL